MLVVDVVRWYLGPTETLTISGSGAMYNYDQYSNTAPWSCDVKTVVIEDGITTIGDNAFYGCYNLTSVTIPNGITRIGEYAFAGSNLTTVTIPASVTEIGGLAFAYIDKPLTIKLTGNAPVVRYPILGENFDVTGASPPVVTFYYPVNNSTWSTATMTSISGGRENVRWIAYKPSQAYNGLTLVDGVWGYYENGELQTDFTGLVLYSGNYYYVQDGLLDFGYTGLTLYNGAWWYVQNGQLIWGYDGLVCHNGVWYYVENSAITWTYTGLVEYMGNWYHVENSSIDWTYTGTAEYNGVEYDVVNGMAFF